MKSYRRLIVLPLVMLTAQLVATPARAHHSWAGLHWARTGNPFTVELGDNVSTAWESALKGGTDPLGAYTSGASPDWSVSTVLDTPVGPGRSNAKRCSATAGRVEVCNSKYGRNGWLGLASVWASDSHITQATVKLNDTYFDTASYNTPAWRNSVMCQEIGHGLGLGHNDEDFTTTFGTCMDYSNDPGPNQHPNAHDYEQLGSIYAHTDKTSTVASPSGSTSARAADVHSRDQWGRAIRYDSKGRPVVFERDLGPGERVFTFVIWAE